MGRYDIEMKYRTMMKGLKKLGLEINNASKHQTATVRRTGYKTTIPRTVVLKKSTVKSILQFLLDNGFEEKEINKAFGL